MHSLFQQYFAISVKNLFNHLHDLELIDSEIPLHDFRVEIKKIKSIQKFLQTIYPKEKFKKTKHLLNNIFQNAGAIRENQIIIKWLQKYGASNIIKKHFPETALEKQILIFRRQNKVYKKTLEEIIERLNKYGLNTNKILFEQYVKSLDLRIEKRLKKSIAQDEWHEIRKLIKQWIYSRYWVFEDEKSKLKFTFNLYNKLQEEIGLWHDLQIVKEAITQKQINLSSDLETQKEIGIISESLSREIRYRKKKVLALLNKIQSDF